MLIVLPLDVQINKLNKCKRKLVPSKDGKTYVPVRACGMAYPGCGNMSKECMSIRFHPLPSDSSKRAPWLQAVKQENVPMTRNSYICSAGSLLCWIWILEGVTSTKGRSVDLRLCFKATQATAPDEDFSPGSQPGAPTVASRSCIMHKYWWRIA